MATLSIIIPTYNEAVNIGATLKEMLGIVKGVVDDYEVVVVDDHSEDNIYDVVKNLGDPNIHCVRLSRRSGSHVAIRAGMRLARGDMVLCISADGQDNPAVLPEMIERWRRGKADVVWALRNSRDDESASYRLMVACFYWLLGSLHEYQQPDIPLSRADFFLLDRKVVEAVNQCPEANTPAFALIAWLGFRQEGVNYDRRHRWSGKSKWAFRTRLRLARDWIIAFSGLPLRIMSLLGLFVSGCGFIFAINTVIVYFRGATPPGYSSIMVAVLVLGGLQMIMLGVIGEYLRNNLDQSRKRPAYFIEKSTREFGEDRSPG